MPRIVQLDPGAEALVPFAEQCVAELRQAGHKYAARRWLMGGYTIAVRINGEHSYVSVTGDPGVRYEFLTYDTGFKLVNIDGTLYPGHENVVWPTGGAYAVGSGVLYKGKSTLPVFAMDAALTPPTLEAGEAYPKWDVITPVEMNSDYGKRTRYRFLSVGVWNNQKFHQHHWWLNHNPDRMVVSCNACGRGKTWFADMSRPALSTVGTTLAQWLTEVDASSAIIRITPPTRAAYRTSQTAGRYLRKMDVEPPPNATRVAPQESHEIAFAFDISPTVLTASKAVRVDYGRDRTAANWRHAAMQVVTGSSGKKYEVLISTDKHGVFAFIIAPEAGTLRGDDADDKIVYAEPAWPAWVERYYIQTDPHAHFQWSFNSSGTRASTTPLSIEPTYIYVGVMRVKATDAFSVYGLLPDTGAQTLDEFMGYFDQAYIAPSSAYEFAVQRVPVYNRKADAPATDYTAWEEIAEGYGFEASQVGDSGVVARGLKVLSATHALLINGQLVPYGLVMHTTAVSSGPGVLIPSGLTLDPTHYEANYTSTPGFMEVEIQLEIDDLIAADDPTITASVTVVESEDYSTLRRFYVDTDYYIPTPRASSNLADGQPPPAKDTLLTAEIELYWMPGGDPEYAVGRRVNKFIAEEWQDHPNAQSQITAHMDAWKCANNLRPPYQGLTTGGGAYTPESPNYPALLEQYRGFDNAEGMAIGGYCGMHLYIYYTVRERDTQRVVTRLCLGHDVDWHIGELNWRDYWRKKVYVETDLYGQRTIKTNNSIAPTFFGAVEQAEIRYLSFFTRSHARRGVSAPDDTDVFDFSTKESMTVFLPPRFELRVPGEKLRTVDHSDPAVSGFGVAYSGDPMATLSEPPSGAVKLPHEHSARGFAYCMYQWVCKALLPTTHGGDNLSFSPTGSWSAYFDRRMADNTTPNPSSTEDSGVFDVICEYRKGRKPKYTTHKDEFNAAFAQSRDYADYDPTEGDIGGFCPHGVWGPRGTKASLVPPDFDDYDN
jgi:hypothetical protein